MRKRKPQDSKQKTQTNSLKDFLSSYDALQLHGALSTFENSLGWDLVRAYAAFVQRTYEVAALDKISKQDELQAAAYAAGYAKACEDLSTFAEGLRKTILGAPEVIETPRPED